MIYQNGSLKEILTPEGYIENGVYYYYLQDHQGNNRVVINSSGAVQEYSHYYPDGMRYIPESSTNAAAIPYRYNNKEFEAMNGLNQYDYGARRKYSWALIFPTSIDPLCEKYYWISPYAYCLDNPINATDPDGMLVQKNEKDGSYTITGNDRYNYYGYLLEIEKGTGSLQNLQESLENASEKDNGNGGQMGSTLDETDIIANAPKKFDQKYGQTEYVGNGQGSESTAEIHGPSINVSMFSFPIGASATSWGEWAYNLAHMLDAMVPGGNSDNDASTKTDPDDIQSYTEYQMYWGEENKDDIKRVGGDTAAEINYRIDKKTRYETKTIKPYIPFRFRKK